MLQASIDERTDVIARLIISAPDLIRSSFINHEKNAKAFAKDNSDGDADVYSSLFLSYNNEFRPEEEEWMLFEFYRAMVMLICSFAETKLKGLLKNPAHSFSSNYLCNAYNQINNESNLGLRSIGHYWKGHQDFTKKRNDITHNRRDVDVTQDELLTALSGVHSLLRAVADAFDRIEKARNI